MLLFCSLSNQENLYMVHYDSNLFYDIYNTTIEHNRRQTHYLLLVPNYFDIYFEWIKKFFYNFICFIINDDFYVITFGMHYMLFIIIYGKKLFAIVNWIFRVTGFLRLFMMSFKCGLTLSRYSSTDSDLFLSPLLSYSIQLLLQKLFSLTGL